MDTKLDISGDTKATYKAIPEADMEEEAMKKGKTAVKVKGVPEADGAHEKMLPKEEKVEIAAKVDAKYSAANEKQNGDAKLDIGEIKQAFVGLTKEELMKYANDPFWVRLRWFLFITFWALWVAMLLGAVMIIYAAPKCDPPPPKTWWQQGPLTEVKESITPDELKSLKEKGVQGVIVQWSDDTYANINDSVAFVELLQKAKEQHTNVIVELDAGNSQVWFQQSERKDPDFIDYYIWRDSKGVNGSGAPIVPNNWLTVDNKTSWKYSEIRKQFYYAPFGEPYLNFRNNNVTEEFSNVITKFLDLGAGGIRLKNIAYLLVDPNFEDEGISTVHGYDLTEYSFYTHTKTENLPELTGLLTKWSKIIKMKTENNGPLMSAEHLNKIESYKVNNSLIVDLPLEPYLFTRPNLSAEAFVKGLHTIFKVNNVQWPLWKYNTSGVLDIVTFLLPGVPLIKEDATLNSELLKLRESPSIQRGSFSFHAIANNTVFAYKRVAAGNPGYLVAYNPTEERVEVDFLAEIPKISEDVTVQLYSSNYQEEGVPLNLKQDAHKIPISPKAAIILSYVPKSD